MAHIPFQQIRWEELPQEPHVGEKGNSTWQVLQLPGLRVRIVCYSPGYVADHWCQKGHVVHCLEGSLTTEMESGEKYEMTAGMSYIVSDQLSSHRSATTSGAKLLIVDGDFLK